jgi:hypothetical protein
MVPCKEPPVRASVAPPVTVRTRKLAASGIVRFQRVEHRCDRLQLDAIDR